MSDKDWEDYILIQAMYEELNRSLQEYDWNQNIMGENNG